MKTKKISSIYMQRWLGAIVCAMVMMFTFTSCDERDPLDLNIYPGFVLCDDHQIMSLEDYKAQLQAPHSVRAVGVIFSTANQDHKTLAVMLFENPGVQFSNYVPLDCSTSCSADAYDGYANSVSLKNTYEEVKFKVDEPDPSDPSKTVQNEYTEVHCSPLGQWVDSSHQYGQSDYIPSRAECRLLFAAVSSVNATIRALGGEEISVNPEDGGDCWYWTSTEDEVDKENRAWLCSMKTGAFQQTPKTERHCARAIVALDY